MVAVTARVRSAGRAGSNAAASEQTYLLGWMAFDDGRRALAQRYLLQSLRLAEASGDAACSVCRCWPG
ncbi:MAG: hypothetical protein JO281_02175 [Pseudonocardiales bacterium]|nr:hypothetical protein [Pseudonocardiales bacterium]